MSSAVMRLNRGHCILIFAVAALLLVPAIGSAQDFKVVVNSSVVDTSVSKNILSKIFLNQHKSWSNGAAVEAVDQSADSNVRDQFSKAVHGRSTMAIKNYWNRMIFSGRAKPPVEQSSDADVMAFVKVHSGAVGYVSARAKLVDGVKILAVSDL